MANMVIGNLKVTSEKSIDSTRELLNFKSRGENIIIVEPNDKEKYISYGIVVQEKEHDGKTIFYYINELDMSQFIPRPEWINKYEDRISTDDENYEKYCKWFKDNYGGPANLFDILITNMKIKFSEFNEDENSFISYSYETKWSPNIEFIKNVSKMYPSLTFEYSYQEDGGQFVGKNIYKNGETIYEDFFSEWECECECITFDTEEECNSFIETTLEGKNEFSFREGFVPLPWEDDVFEIKDTSFTYDKESKLIYSTSQVLRRKPETVKNNF